MKEIVPKANAQMKDMNDQVDKKLVEVVKKINIKKEAEKKQRELFEKYTKRQDEVRNLELQQQMTE